MFKLQLYLTLVLAPPVLGTQLLPVGRNPLQSVSCLESRHRHTPCVHTSFLDIDLRYCCGEHSRKTNSEISYLIIFFFRAEYKQLAVHNA